MLHKYPIYKLENIMVHLHGVCMLIMSVKQKFFLTFWNFYTTPLHKYIPYPRVLDIDLDLNNDIVFNLRE